MIYLDHAATTPIDKQVAKDMELYNTKNFGNPSSLYKLGRQASQAINQSREKVAKILNCSTQEIIFTAGGTESNNLAILGVISNFDKLDKHHAITTNIEHPAVLNTFKALEKKGLQVTPMGVDKYGLINVQDVIRNLKPNTVLVSIMYANNEIGTIQPINEIAKAIKNYYHIQRVDRVAKDPHYPVFHTDACQAAGYLDIDVDKLGVDLMTLNGSKIYGSKQTGILFKSNDVKLAPVIYGGDQEFKLRPGTENVAGIVGFAKALELVEKDKAKENKRLAKLRDYLIMQLLEIPNTVLNGHPQKRLANNVNVSFMGVEGESVLLKLDKEEVYVSTGSACHSLSLKPSYVITALNQDAEQAHSSIRFSMGKSTTKKDIDYVLKTVKKVVKELRKISAVNHKNTKTQKTL